MNTAMLIPFGSEGERIRGIAHLFEHVVIHKMLYLLKDMEINGFTTEDYIVIFTKKGDMDSMFNVLRNFSIDEDILEKEKEALIAEIGRESSREEEAFFSFVWQGTQYSHSPLGCVEDIETITTGDFEMFKKKVLQGPVYFYTPDGITVKGSLAGLGSAAIDLPEKSWKGEFDDHEYRICYLTGEGDDYYRSLNSLYIIERIANKIFPGYTTGLFEKRKLSVFVVSMKGWITEAQLLSHKRRVLDDIEHELREIRGDFRSLSLNELESTYFYNTTWESRVNQLVTVTDDELISAFRMISR